MPSFESFPCAVSGVCTWKYVKNICYFSFRVKMESNQHSNPRMYFTGCLLFFEHNRNRQVLLSSCGLCTAANNIQVVRIFVKNFPNMHSPRTFHYISYLLRSSIYFIIRTQCVNIDFISSWTNIVKSRDMLDRYRNHSEIF